MDIGSAALHNVIRTYNQILPSQPYGAGLDPREHPAVKDRVTISSEGLTLHKGTPRSNADQKVTPREQHGQQSHSRSPR